MQLGALAVCTRQTNVIWMVFVACEGVIDMLLISSSSVQKSNLCRGDKDGVILKHVFTANPGARRRKRPRNSQA